MLKFINCLKKLTGFNLCLLTSVSAMATSSYQILPTEEEDVWDSFLEAPRSQNPASSTKILTVKTNVGLHEELEDWIEIEVNPSIAESSEEDFHLIDSNGQETVQPLSSSSKYLPSKQSLMEWATTIQKGAVYTAAPLGYLGYQMIKSGANFDLGSAVGTLFNVAGGSYMMTNITTPVVTRGLGQLIEAVAPRAVLSNDRLKVMDCSANFEKIRTSIPMQIQEFFDMKATELRIALSKGDYLNTPDNLDSLWILNALSKFPTTFKEIDLKYAVEHIKSRMMNYPIKTLDSALLSIGTFIRKSREDVSKKQCIYIYGPKGSGKTNLAKIIAEAFSLPCKMINISEVPMDTFIGTTKQRPEPLLDALTHADQNYKNNVIIMDEIDKTLNCEARNPKLAAFLKYVTTIVDPNLNSFYSNKLFRDVPFDGSIIIGTGEKPPIDKRLTQEMHIIECLPFEKNNKAAIAESVLKLKLKRTKLTDAEKITLEKMVEVDGPGGLTVLMKVLEQYADYIRNDEFLKKEINIIGEHQQLFKREFNIEEQFKACRKAMNGGVSVGDQDEDEELDESNTTPKKNKKNGKKGKGGNQKKEPGIGAIDVRSVAQGLLSAITEKYDLVQKNPQVIPSSKMPSSTLEVEAFADNDKQTGNKKNKNNKGEK